MGARCTGMHLAHLLLLLAFWHAPTYATHRHCTFFDRRTPAPDQHRWLRPRTGELTICAGFCDEIFAACSSTLVDGRPFARFWGSGASFCEAHNYKVANRRGDRVEERCFNASTRGESLNVFVILFTMIALMRNFEQCC